MLQTACRRRPLAALAAAALIALAAGSVEARDLTIVSWGGAYQDAQRQVYFEPFMKETGLKVLEDSYNGGLAQMKSQVETNSVVWDVVQVETPELIRGCEEGLFVPMRWDLLGGKDKFLESAVTDCGAGTIVWSVVLAYDAARMPDGPKSWADFWNVQKFPGKRALRKGAKFTLEIALMADGVPPDKVYEVLGTAEGVERAFKKLDELKPHIQWWEAGAQPPEWLASGDVIMTSAYNGRISAANKEGRNFKIAWDGQIYQVDSWVVVKGSPNEEQAFKFIAFASDPAHQKALPPLIPYGPTHKDAVGQVTADVAMDLPTHPDNLKNALANDIEFWVDHEEELNARFTAWAAQ